MKDVNDIEPIVVQTNTITGGTRMLIKEIDNSKWTGKYMSVEINDKEYVMSLAFALLSSAGCDEDMLSNFYKTLTR